MIYEVFYDKNKIGLVNADPNTVQKLSEDLCRDQVGTTINLSLVTFDNSNDARYSHMK